MVVIIWSLSWSLWPHGLQHTRLPCPSLSPRVCSNSCPLRRWCHRTISSSVIPFSSCLQSFPVLGCFQMNQFFTSGGQSIGVFSFSVSPSNEYSRLISFRIDWLEFFVVQGTLKSLLQKKFKNINSLAPRFLYGPTLISIHDCWKSQSFDNMDLCQQSNVLWICCLGWSLFFFQGTSTF